MNRDDALGILELNNNTTITQINHKYENLLRLSKFDQSIDVNQICNAYDFLVYNSHDFTHNKSKFYSNLDNFFYYHLKTIILLIFLIIFITLSSLFIYFHLISHPKPDMTLIFIGNQLITVEETKTIKNYCKDNLTLETIDVQTYILVKKNTYQFGELTIEEISKIINNTSSGFIITNEISMLELVKAGLITDLTLHWNNLGINEDDKRIYKLYSSYGNALPYALKPYGTDILGVNDLLRTFPYIAILKNTAFNNKTYVVIKNILN